MIRMNEKSKNQPDYFSIIKVIDKAFPPIEEFDYTKITTDDLTKRFKSIIDEFAYVIPSERIVSILKAIKSKHKDIYKKNFHVSKKGEVSNDFDQRNYFIQNRISSLKNTTIHQICNEYLKYLYSGEENNHYNNFYMGNINNIKKYIASTLNVTKEATDDGYHLDWEEVAKDILLHLGINPYKKDTLSASDFLVKLSEKIKNIFDSATKYNEHIYIEKDSRTIDEISDEITEFISNLISYNIDPTIDIENHPNYFNNDQNTLSATIKH